MSEHAQLELIAAVVLISMNIINAWRTEIASRYAKQANDQAVRTGAKQIVDIAEVHTLVNGGLHAAKKEVEDLKTETNRLNMVIAEMVRTKAEADVVTPEKRLNEIRGQE